MWNLWNPAFVNTFFFLSIWSWHLPPHTWILFLASRRCWMSLGQSCLTTVSCLSWQSRYFSPASMYSLHSWVWRLMTPALPLPRTRPPAPLSVAFDPGTLRGSADPRSSKRRTTVRRCMAGEVRRVLLLLGWNVGGTQEAGQSCTYRNRQNREQENVSEKVKYHCTCGYWIKRAYSAKHLKMKRK